MKTKTIFLKELITSVGTLNAEIEKLENEGWEVISYTTTNGFTKGDKYDDNKPTIVVMLQKKVKGNE